MVVLGSGACSWERQNSDFEDSSIVLTHFRVLKLADVGRISEQGKGGLGCVGPRARRLISYIGAVARGWAAYVSYEAPERVAMSSK